ncbi:hypothetical protein KY343_02370 [Candidatus Woesearchaeota archaeon]|nr:hypothetical protein [Candidatus Woesearchaeota archaeon]
MRIVKRGMERAAKERLRLEKGNNYQGDELVDFQGQEVIKREFDALDDLITDNRIGRMDLHVEAGKPVKTSGSTFYPWELAFIPEPEDVVIEDGHIVEIRSDILGYGDKSTKALKEYFPNLRKIKISLLYNNLSDWAEGEFIEPGSHAVRLELPPEQVHTVTVEQDGVTIEYQVALSEEDKALGPFVLANKLKNTIEAGGTEEVRIKGEGNSPDEVYHQYRMKSGVTEVRTDEELRLLNRRGHVKIKFADETIQEAIERTKEDIAVFEQRAPEEENPKFMQQIYDCGKYMGDYVKAAAHVQRAIDENNYRDWKDIRDALFLPKEVRFNGELFVKGAVNEPSVVALEQLIDKAEAHFSSQEFTLFMPALESLFPDSYQLVAELVDKKIEDLETITLDSISGKSGGGVGRFDDNGRDCVFKVEKDFLAAYKSAKTADLIHERAKTDNLAARLARRIPKPIFSEPIQREGYWVTFSEDVSNKVVVYDSEDLKVMGPELEKGLDPNLVENLYTIALYHEVVGNIVREQLAIQDPRKILAAKIIAAPGNVKTYLSKEEILDRFKQDKDIYSQIEKELGKLLRNYEPTVAELAELEKKGRTLGHYDNKPDNNLNGYLLDLGCTKLGFEIDDLARALMDRPDIVGNRRLFNNYLGCYASMRQKLNADYYPTEGFSRHVLNQTKINAIRNAGWALNSEENRSKFASFYEVARKSA